MTLLFLVVAFLREHALKFWQLLRLWLFIGCSLLLSSCATLPVQNSNNLCAIFDQHPNWYRDTLHAQARFGTPIWVQMAIMRVESDFDATARPPREYLLGVIPWTRLSSAYGYSQALVGTWRDYESVVDKREARNHFRNAADFVAWYTDQSHWRLHIPMSDVYALYLAYHEGWTGYAERTYWDKPWLKQVAWRANSFARLYQEQLWHCR